MKYAKFLRSSKEDKYTTIKYLIASFFNEDIFSYYYISTEEEDKKYFVVYAITKSDKKLEFRYDLKNNSLTFQVSDEIRQMYQFGSIFKLIEDAFNKVVEDYNLHDNISGSLITFDKKYNTPSSILTQSNRFTISDFFEKPNKKSIMTVQTTIYCNDKEMLNNNKDNFISLKVSKNPEFSINASLYEINSGNYNYKKSVKFKPVDYYSFFENIFFQAYLKKHHDIKTKSKKDLDLLKIIRY